MYNREIQERLETIRERVLQITGIDVVKEKRRLREIVYAKKIFCNIAREKMATYHQMADFLGMNHAGCINHVKDFKFLLKFDDQLKQNYLRAKGLPPKGRMSREYFDLTIGMI